MMQPARLFALLLTALLLASACTSAPTSTAPTSTAPTATETTPPTRASILSPDFDVTGFDDHSTGSIGSIEDFEALARTEGDLSVVKFVVPDLRAERTDDPRFATRWMDGNFYELHDEWYWFRLLNGVEAPGFATAPADIDVEFDTIADVYAWAETQDDLPVGLDRIDSTVLGRERIYSSAFYSEVLTERDDRSYGVGSLVRFAGDQDYWLMELEFRDDADPEQIGLLFDRLIETLPASIGDELLWVIRSPIQETTAAAMVARGSAEADRVVRYSEIVPPGETRVYNPGIAAGRLRLIESGEAATADDDIVLIENVPDFLPPASALITSAPQTPLAHVNLLARNRGIPNASLSGLLDDPNILQAARSRAPAIVRADADGNLEIVLITDEEYREWRGLGSVEPISVPEIADDQPLVIDLTTLETTINTESDVDAWRPIIGGKAAGFLALLGADGIDTPLSPQAITIGAYDEHLANVTPQLDAMLDDPTFQGNAWTRFLLLEGLDDFNEDFDPDGRYQADLDAYRKIHPTGSPIGDILDAGGLKSLIRDVDIDPDTLDALMAELETTFEDLAPTQGLRFRSSSNVEDIEGFNGAGLYDSNTGFLQPELQSSERDQGRSVEWALKKTWASYWGFEAFEERRREQVDHRSGSMAVLVHPRFDDELELNNGVATLTISGGEATAVINVQRGDVSVTNPDPDDVQLPEETVATLDPISGEWALDRTAESTIEGDGPVLDDDEVITLADQLLTVTTLWRDRVNDSLDSQRQISTVTLDFEFKTMDEGWPALRTGPDAVGGLIIKQARSLDPGLRSVPADVIDLPVPRDVLARARLVERLTCDGASFVSVLTDPLLDPDLGFSVDPFRSGDAAAFDADPADCDREILYSSPDQFLLELIADDGRLDLLAS